MMQCVSFLIMEICKVKFDKHVHYNKLEKELACLVLTSGKSVEQQEKK